MSESETKENARTANKTDLGSVELYVHGRNTALVQSTIVTSQEDGNGG